jgi:hypothetical protein
MTEGQIPSTASGSAQLHQGQKFTSSAEFVNQFAGFVCTGRIAIGFVGAFGFYQKFYILVCECRRCSARSHPKGFWM